jgi:hypothetical protein
MAKDYGLQEIDFGSLSGKIKMIEKSGLEMILTQEPLCFAQA